MADLNKKERPEISIPNSADKHLPLELFQNEVLRPIIKLQHDILLASFHLCRERFCKDWELLTNAKKKAYISDLLQKNGPLKNTIIGIVIGQFDLDEMEAYSKDRKEYDRRISGMVIQRVKSTL